MSCDHDDDDDDEGLASFLSHPIQHTQRLAGAFFGSVVGIGAGGPLRMCCTAAAAADAAGERREEPLDGPSPDDVRAALGGAEEDVAPAAAAPGRATLGGAEEAVAPTAAAAPAPAVGSGS